MGPRAMGMATGQTEGARRATPLPAAGLGSLPALSGPTPSTWALPPCPRRVLGIHTRCSRLPSPPQSSTHTAFPARGRPAVAWHGGRRQATSGHLRTAGFPPVKLGNESYFERQQIQ